MADKLPVEQNSPWSSHSPDPRRARAHASHRSTLQTTARWRTISRQLAPRPAEDPEGTPEPARSRPESLPETAELLAVPATETAPDEPAAPDPERVTARWTDVVEIALTHRPGRGEIVAAALAVAVLLVVSCVLLARPHPHAAAAQTSAVQINRGFTLGRVQSNDGRKLQVQDALGAVSTIRTTPDTEVLVLLATRVPDIATGALIMVHGNREADGSITANLIMGVGTDAGGK
ncbi:hypothetical protein [Nocardia sp. BMG111209]|uniref:hypothetical protein n=1 Tax=Nocardia sp. BMG111209 TaxID=1160137 RepID=UPI000371AC28|nr:hypothetical protein [Nocardia sp. BMG111209]